jgi:hypothetical protein
MINEVFFKNLVILFKIFKERPNHLVKYLSDNEAFSEDFIKTIINSERLNDLRPKDEVDYFNNNFSYSEDNLSFSSFDEMNEYYEDILKNIKPDNDSNSLMEQLNVKLENYIKNEKYEEAAKLRDYMYNKNIKIIKQ